MKNLLFTIGVNLVSLACVSAAAYLAIQEKDGWGWFLTVAVIAQSSVKFTSKD